MQDRTFKYQRSHFEYQQFVKEKIKNHFIDNGKADIIDKNKELVVKFWITDLDKVRDLTQPLYKSINTGIGRTPTDPTCLLRALLLMTQVKETSITNWTDKLFSTELFAILSGFEPTETPGVGTFYDFIDRLWLEKDEPKKAIRKFNAKPRKKTKNEKVKPKHPGIVLKIADRIIKSEMAIKASQELSSINQNSFDFPPEKLINDIFKWVFVMPSNEKQLLQHDSTTNNNTNIISISADGSLIKSGASHYGIKICNCKLTKNLPRCDCKRKFSDTKANWGWDSYREIWVYGRTTYQIVASSSQNDLPIYLKLAQASRHDSVTSLFALRNAKSLYKEFTFSEAQLDSAHDCYGVYKLLDFYNTEPFINLNEKNKNNFFYQKTSISNDGIPVCNGNFQMIHSGFCSDRQRIKWRCPLKAKKNSKIILSVYL